VVSSRLVEPQRYSGHEHAADALASSGLAKAIVREIAPDIRKLVSQGIDITFEVHEYKTSSVEGKYTHGVYTKLRMITPQEPDPELDIDDDALLKIVERHLSALNRQVVDLHQRVQRTLSEMRALEQE